jgi:hypothetical protein
VTLLEAALATSAAPTYFAPAVVGEQHKNKVLYWDGAIGENRNNPVWAAWEECKLEHAKDPEIIVSVGTGQKLPKPAPKKYNTDLHMNWSLLKDMRREVTESEKTHKRFDEHVKLVNKVRKFDGCDGIIYERFNIPAEKPGDGISHIALDEWEPAANGKVTKSQISAAVDKYLADGEVRPKMKAVARKLVEKRKLRFATPRWREFVASND